MKGIIKAVLHSTRVIRLYILYTLDFRKFTQLAKGARPDMSVEWKDRYPCLLDNTTNTDFDRHYVYHTAWAARVVRDINPAKHVDISSSLHFSTIVSAFINIDFYDYRPAKLDLDNIDSMHGDLMGLPFVDGAVESLSCMHVIEHVGLGRYGDPLDFEGDLKAIKELVRVLKTGGHLLFVTPVGRPRTMFNAHRIYSFEQIINYFHELKLKEFSLVPDNPSKGSFIRNADPALVKEQTYGCGCFHFVKE
jgi:SAM-dependent methyltransferase